MTGNEKDNTIQYDFTFTGVMSFDWKYHKWTYINNLEDYGENITFKAECSLKIALIEGFFNASFAPVNLQKHLEVHVSSFQLKRIADSTIQGVTTLKNYPFIYDQVGPLISSELFEQHLGQHF